MSIVTIQQVYSVVNSIKEILVKYQNYKICALFLSSVLVGCGGGGSGSSATAPAKTGFANGLYTDADNFTLMLVDSTRTKNNLVIGDFAGNGVYVAHSGTATETTYVTKGLTHAESGIFIYDTNLPLTSTFTDNSAVVTGSIYGQNLVYSFDKAADSKSLSEITGSFTNSDSGAVWSIDSVGNFTLNGDCQVSGKLSRHGAYFNVTEIVASNCADSSYDGLYDDGVLVTFQYSGHDYLAGVMGRNDAMMWGSVAMN